MEGDELFYDPATLRVIRAALASKGVRRQELPDLMHDVVEACFLRVRETGQPAKDVADAIRIARPIANGDGIDEARKQGRQAKTNVGPTDAADEHAREPARSMDPVDEARMFEALEGVLQEKEKEELVAVGAGIPQSEIAAEDGASAAAMRKRVQKSRVKARGALQARGYWVAGGFAALLAGVLGVFVLRAPERGGVASAPPVATPAERAQAADLRRVAAEACAAERWDACEDALDRASRLDHAGERERDVLVLRAAIAAGRAGVDAGDDGTR